MSLRKIALIGAGLVLGGGVLLAATPLGRDLLIHAVPLGWTGEADRLADAVHLRPGSVVADIGAGNGALIVELARLAGPAGRALASERTASQRQAIEQRARAARVAVTVIEAAEHASNLTDACCDVITMRMVMHHLADPGAFARDLRRAIRPDGRVGIIDFAPGALPHLADDHGVAPERLESLFTAAGFDVADRQLDWGGRTYLIVFRPR